ncbi:MAG: hypothetical protein ACO1RA_13130 [Planctomycetaceae bacterium]
MRHHSQEAWHPIRVAERSRQITIDLAPEAPSAITHFYRIMGIDSPPLAIHATVGSSASTIDDTRDAIAKISAVNSLGMITVFLPPGFPEDDIAPLKGLPCLYYVLIQGDDFTAEGFHHLSGCNSIESVTLPGMYLLTNKGICCLTEIPNLLELDLSDSVIPVGSFKALTKSSTLQTLILNASEFDISELPDLIGMQGLIELDLSSTDVSDGDLIQIAKFKGLRKIDLKSTLVTSKGRDDLARSRPDLEIEWEPRKAPRLVPR